MIKNKLQKRSKRIFNSIYLGMIALVSAGEVLADDPVVWVQSTAGGEVRFYDWGYHGPNDRRANDFEAVNGFNGAAQVQHVVTTGPDGLTPDAPMDVYEDLNYETNYYEANMDSVTNFYDWAYTTRAGSTFSNMQIDADGDYYIAREDMSFNWFGDFDYTYEGTDAASADLLYPGKPYNGVADGTYATNIGFQPYALSDAKGWCGSVTASNPSSLEAMAGQVTFDFGFEAFLPTTPLGDNGLPDPGEGGMQIVQNFQMRSFGSIEVDVAGVATQRADAVVNNTNPLDSTVELDINGNPVMIEVPLLNMDGTAALDVNGVARTMMMPKKTVGGGGSDVDSYNEVSFMGGGIVPAGVWVSVVDVNASMSNDNIVAVLDADDGDANTIWWQNSFANYPFLLRADGLRIVDALDFSLYNDYCAIPGAICDADGNFIGADSNAPGSAFNSKGELINLEGTVIQDLSAVPVPPAVWLFGSGLFALFGFSRRKKQVK